MEGKTKQWNKITLYAILATVVLHVLVFLSFNLTTIQSEISVFSDAAILELDYREPEEIEKMLLPPEQNIDESNQSIKDLMQDIQDIRNKSRANYSESQINQEIENKVNETNKQSLNEINKGENATNTSSGVDMPKKETTKTEKSSEAENSYAGKVTRYCNVPGRECYTVAPSYTCKGGGKVQIDIKVDKIGTVRSVKVNSANTTTTNECILNQALDYAKRTTKVSSDLKGEHANSGYIIYNFVSQ
ncbi:MAG: hypothetical protein ABF238_02390 [Flavobacteriales bacterium]